MSKFKKISLVLLLSMCFVGSIALTNSVRAISTSEIQALIDQIKAQIAQLQAQLLVLSPSSPGPAWCHTFNSNLGFVNSGSPEVSALHTALDKENISYGNDDTSTYAEDTAAAVVQLQAKYGIRQTGYVGPLTRAKLNSLYGCSNATQITPPSTTTDGVSTTNIPTGACELRDAYTSIPTYTSPDIGKGYAKLQKNGSRTGGTMLSACSADDFAVLLKNYCASNTNPAQQEVVVYSEQGGLVSASCVNNLQCERISCPTTTSAPVITSITPKSGSSGVRIIIYGTNLSKATSVGFYSPGSMEASFAIVAPGLTITDSSISFTLPQNFAGMISSGPHNVSVMTPAGNSNYLSFNHVGLSIAVKDSPTTAVIGGSYQISWVTTGDIAQVSIGFCPQGEDVYGNHCIEGTLKPNTGIAIIPLTGYYSFGSGSYSSIWYPVIWNVSPGATQPTYGIGNVFTVTGNSTATQPSITITSPQINDVWEIGKKYTISWSTASPSSSYCSIYMTQNGVSGSRYLGTSSNCNLNGGSYEYTVSDLVNPPGNWNLWVCGRYCPFDGGLGVSKPVTVIRSSGTVSTPPMSLTLSSPNGGEVLNNNQAYNIKWQSSNLPTNAKVQIQLVDETNPTTIQYIISDNIVWASVGSYNWTVPSKLQKPFEANSTVLSGNKFRIFITYTSSTSNDQARDLSDSYFSIVGSSTSNPPLASNGGACILRDAYASAPTAFAVNVGTGYAKTMQSSTTSYADTLSQCTQAVFNDLLTQYCAAGNKNPAQQGVVYYGQSSTAQTSGCGPDAFNCVSRTCP